MPLCIANLRSNYLSNSTVLPSYEEALSMSTAPNSNTVSSSHRAPPYEAVVPKNDRQLRYARIAPDRPGSRRTLVLPPSYDSAISTDHAPQSPEMRPTSSNLTSLYTVS